MYRPPHRAAATLAAAVAALALSATPALAGSDGCDEDGCQAENSPPSVVEVAPTPPTLIPGPELAGDSGPETAATRHERARTRHIERGTRTVKVPVGAVAAGAGGIAPHGPAPILAGLGGAGAVLFVTGGGLVAATRPRRS
jgi:hypothetical protein